jgi:fermentation-respiration switch protein FrsA (DUF1100 family)
MKTTIALAAALMGSTMLAGQASAGDVATRAFTFQNEGATLSATLHLPASRRAGERLPVVLVTGAWTSVEEQMPREYAREMVERGFAAVTFDFRGWGKSGDQANGVRFKEDPQAKISDLKAAIGAVASLPEIDASRLSGLGICASAGYMLDATRGDARIGRVALVAPWLQDRAIVNQIYGGEQGVAALKALATAPNPAIIPAAGPVGATGVLMPLGGYYYEPSRGAVPAYDNRWNNAGWDDWLTYHPLDRAAAFDKPLAIVHSEAAAIPQGVRAFLASYRGQASVTWLPNVTQFDFYDQRPAVELASDAVAAHFRAN